MAILGIDEVGRGPWAGPLVVGACVLGDAKIEGLTDSKKLSAKKREALAGEISEKCEYGLGWVYADELDKIGLSAALRKACREAVKQIQAPYHEIIIDGTVNFLSDTPLCSYVQVLKKADLLVPEVSAASIIAKVARDRYEKYGVCPEHRKSFRPIAEIINAHGGEKIIATGDIAEQKVADFLRKNGHAILARNWRTKYCEIDIVSQKDDVFYFTEVKYRRNTRNSDGLDAITQRKLSKMQLGAMSFAQENGLQHNTLRLAVAAVSGDNYQITNLIVLQ